MKEQGLSLRSKGVLPGIFALVVCAGMLASAMPAYAEGSTPTPPVPEVGSSCVINDTNQVGKIAVIEPGNQLGLLLKKINPSVPQDQLSSGLAGIRQITNDGSQKQLTPEQMRSIQKGQVFCIPCRTEWGCVPVPVVAVHSLTPTPQIAAENSGSQQTGINLNQILEGLKNNPEKKVLAGALGLLVTSGSLLAIIVGLCWPKSQKNEQKVATPSQAPVVSRAGENRQSLYSLLSQSREEKRREGTLHHGASGNGNGNGNGGK